MDLQLGGLFVLFRLPPCPWYESHEGMRLNGGVNDVGHGSGACRPTLVDTFTAVANTQL